MRSTKLLPLTFLTAALGACSADRGPAPAIQRQIGLTAFDTCDELEAYVEDTAVRQMRNQLDPENWNHSPVGVLAAGGDARAAPESAAPSDYTRTNTQVEGVDEADFVKTDGTHIYTLAGRTLYLAKSWPAAELAVQGSLRIEGYPREMFLEEDTKRISVLSTVPSDYWDAQAPEIAWYCAEWGCGVEYAATKLTIVDATDPARPAVIAEHYLPGRYQSSRRIGTALRVVLADEPRWPADLRWWPETNENIWDDTFLRNRRFRELMDRNEEIIRAQALADWLPLGRRRIAGGTLTDLAYRCGDFSRPNGPVELGITSVATIDLADPNAGVEQTAVLARTHIVYANATSLYLADQHWWWWPAPGQVDWSYLFKFDLSDPRRARFVAAGGVEGHLLDQFSMDEREGYLRVATTIARRVEDNDSRWGRVDTTNRVSVLDRDLAVVGQTPDLAAGERIFSARFVGTRGFVVTFRQVDPLFTLDLSDPRAPRVVGELKVPGFSTYIHPLGANHLLTIGIHQDEPDPNGQVNWNRRALKLSIFDVSDFARPREAFTQLVGTSASWSEALHEHKAFNYFAARGLLAIPFADWSGGGWGGFVSQLKVYEVDTARGFTAKGAIDMGELYTRFNSDGWSWYFSPWIRRSVMADAYVYAVSDAGIRAAHVDALDRPLATVLFEDSRVVAR